jgi:hypothetical protein
VCCAQCTASTSPTTIPSGGSFTFTAQASGDWNSFSVWSCSDSLGNYLGYGSFQYTLTQTFTNVEGPANITCLVGVDGLYNVATCSASVTVRVPLQCAPSSQVVLVGAPANLAATGGNGTYTWSAPGGSPSGSSGPSPSFSTVYSAPSPPGAPYTVTVSGDGQTESCTVTVTGGCSEVQAAYP